MRIRVTKTTNTVQFIKQTVMVMIALPMANRIF